MERARPPVSSRLQGPFRGLVPAGTQRAKQTGRATPCCALHPGAGLEVKVKPRQDLGC